MSQPKVAIVTLNWNGKDHLNYFLPTVRYQSYENFETIFVDNGSTDESLAFVSENYPEIKILELGENKGYAIGMNCGIKKALELDAEYILITNNDVKLDSNIIEEGIKLAIKDKKIGYISGKIYNLNDPKIFQYAGGRISKGPKKGQNRGKGEKDVGQYEMIEDFEFMDDVCVLASSEMIRKIGAYNEDFFFDFEETEWNIRIRNGNFRIVYNPRMKVWHRLHGSTGGNRFQPIPEYYHWRGKIIFNYITKQGFNLMFSVLKIFFKELPLHYGNLIIKNKTYLILHNFIGIASGLKRVVSIGNNK